MEHLPETVLESIFDQTDDDFSLKDLLFVCWRFRNVILRSSLLMKKLAVEFRETEDIFLNASHTQVQKVLRGSDKIQEVKIVGSGCLGQISPEIIKSLRTLRFKKSIEEGVITRVQLSKFIKFINFADNLEILLCSELEEIEVDDNRIELIPKQLQRLEIIDKQNSFLDKNLQTKQLVVNFLNSTDDPEKIALFIETQISLKTLELRSTLINNFELRTDCVKFMLDDLKIIGIETIGGSSNVMRNRFVNFVKNQNLKSFQLRYSVLDELIYIVLVDMKELKTLKLSADCLSDSTFNNLTYVQNISVSKLIVDQQYTEDIFNALLRTVPNVTNLRCTFKLSSQHFLYISTNLSKLKYFSLQSFNENLDFSSFGSFPAVETLVIDAIRFGDHLEEDWTEFASKFSNVKHLIFKQGPYKIENLLYEIVEIFLSNMKKLTILELGGEQVNRDVLLTIAKSPYQLKVFKFEEGHGIEEDLHEIFKDTDLLVSACPASYFDVKYNRYEEHHGSFGSDPDWDIHESDELDIFEDDHYMSEDDYDLDGEF